MNYRTAALIGSLIAGLPLLAVPPSRFALLEIGDFHGSDVSMHQPRKWLGLYCDKLSCSTRPVYITTARVVDEVGDEDSKNPTGTRINVAGPDRPLYLFRGLDYVQKEIPTAFNEERSLDPGDKFPFSLNGRSFTLNVSDGRSGDDSFPEGTTLTLSDGTLSQQLYGVPRIHEDPFIEILWIGDLDGDGKPDLLVNASWHYNVSHKVVWLSSLSKPSQLVGQAAYLETVGC